MLKVLDEVAAMNAVGTEGTVDTPGNDVAVTMKMIDQDWQSILPTTVESQAHTTETENGTSPMGAVDTEETVVIKPKDAIITGMENEAKSLSTRTKIEKRGTQMSMTSSKKRTTVPGSTKLISHIKVFE